MTQNTYVRFVHYTAVKHNQLNITQKLQISQKA